VVEPLNDAWRFPYASRRRHQTRVVPALQRFQALLHHHVAPPSPRRHALDGRLEHHGMRVPIGRPGAREDPRREATRGEKRRAEHRWCVVPLWVLCKIPAPVKFRGVWIFPASTSGFATSVSVVSSVSGSWGGDIASDGGSVGPGSFFVT